MSFQTVRGYREERSCAVQAREMGWQRYWPSLNEITGESDGLRTFQAMLQAQAGASCVSKSAGVDHGVVTLRRNAEWNGLARQAILHAQRR